MVFLSIYDFVVDLKFDNCFIQLVFRLSISCFILATISYLIGQFRRFLAVTLLEQFKVSVLDK